MAWPGTIRQHHPSETRRGSVETDVSAIAVRRPNRHERGVRRQRYRNIQLQFTQEWRGDYSASSGHRTGPPAAAARARSASPPPKKVAATTQDEVEDPAATPSIAPQQPEHHETEIVTHKTRKRVRFAENLPRNDHGRHTPGPPPPNLHRSGWTWGVGTLTVLVRSTSAFRHPNQDDLKPNRRQLKAAMWELRVAGHVAAGCVCPWSDSHS
eukprot:6305420-Prymnesium_polylepis.1